MNTALAAVIESRSVAVPFSGCWIWMGSTVNGYGQMTYKGKHMMVHRASFLAHHPGIQKPKLVCHHCDIRECVNPDHLYSGDFVSNRADMLARKRWAHPYGLRDSCSAGHVYEQVGFRIDKHDGSRVCKECQKLHKRRYRAIEKEQS